MTESSLWRYIKAGLANHRILLTRIESSSGNGVPDVTYTTETGHHWLELKYIKEWPKRESTLVKLPLRPEQKLWINTRGSLGGDVRVLVRIENEFFLVSHHEIYELCEGKTRAEWRKDYCFEGYWKDRIDFEELYRELL